MDVKSKKKKKKRKKKKAYLMYHAILHVNISEDISN